MFEASIPSFKMYMTYPAMMIGDQDMFCALQELKKYGGIAGVHCENAGVIDALIAAHKAAGQTAPSSHPECRPNPLEAEAVAHLLRITEVAGVPIVIVHLSTKEALLEVMRARARGQQVYVETCPHYLEFTRNVFKREDGRNFVCSPPMKGEESRLALWDAVKRGEIDTIATDHCPFQQSEKDWGKDDFRKIPNGCAGVENMYPYMLSAANTGVISFPRAVEICCFNPAKIFGCTQKGSLAVGKDADIVIYDPTKEFTIHQTNMHSDSDHTIWEGIECHGYPVQTYSRGRLVYDNGEYVGERGWGKMVKRVARK